MLVACKRSCSIMVALMAIITTVAAFTTIARPTSRPILSFQPMSLHGVMDGNEQHDDRRAFLKSTVGFAAAATAGIFSGMSFDPTIAVAADDDAAKTTLHIVDYPVKGSCGEGKVPEAGVFFAKNLGGMVDGSCASVGYSVPQGTAQGTGDKDKQRTFDIYGKE